jgi:polyhydroxybutyrate depolymerase
MRMVFIIALTCTGICLLQGTIFSEDKSFTARIGGRERTWLVHTPPAYDGKAALPAVLVLHGGGGNGMSIARATAFSAKSDKEGFIVVYPDGTGRLKKRGLTWNAGNGSGYALANNIDDIGFLRALITWLKRKYNVDPKRIFCTGLSNGGMMTYRAARELSEFIAAAGVVSGVIAAEGAAPSRPVPMIIFHGTADEHILYQGGIPDKTLDYPIRNDKPVSFAVNFWVKHNGCTTTPFREEKGEVIHEIYGGGKDGAVVELYTIKGGGHGWFGGTKAPVGDTPSGAVSATDLIWEFFKKHPMP